jgi:hypothetical protein
MYVCKCAPCAVVALPVIESHTFFTKKAVESISNKGGKKGRRRKGEAKKRGSPSPRRREACNIICTTLLQGIKKIGTERAMKNHRKMVHELLMHVPKKSMERDRCRPPYKLLQTRHRIISTYVTMHYTTFGCIIQ